jgi:hypothetical protein
MSVSVGTGGMTTVGVLVGGGAATNTAAPAKVVSTLPFTGASHIAIMVAIAVVLLIVGVLAVGLARRPADGQAP